MVERLGPRALEPSSPGHWEFWGGALADLDGDDESGADGEGVAGERGLGHDLAEDDDEEGRRKLQKWGECRKNGDGPVHTHLNCISWILRDLATGEDNGVQARREKCRSTSRSGE